MIFFASVNEAKRENHHEWMTIVIGHLRTVCNIAQCSTWLHDYSLMTLFFSLSLSLSLSWVIFDYPLSKRGRACWSFERSHDRFCASADRPFAVRACVYAGELQNHECTRSAERGTVNSFSKDKELGAYNKARWGGTFFFLRKRSRTRDSASGLWSSTSPTRVSKI